MGKSHDGACPFDSAAQNPISIRWVSSLKDPSLATSENV